MIKWVLLCCATIVVACGGSSAPPEGLLPRERFEELLAASLLIEARASHGMVVDIGTVGSTKLALYDSLFAGQGTDAATFKRTYQHYLEQPDELKAVYEAALERLQLQADSIGAAPAQP